MASSSQSSIEPGFAVCPACQKRTALQYFKQIGNQRLCVVCASQVENVQAKKAQAKQIKNRDAAFTRKVIGLGFAGCVTLAAIVFGLYYWLDHKKSAPVHLDPAAQVSQKPPQTAGSVSTSVTINLRGDVLFNPGKTTLEPAAESALSELAAAISQVPNGKILILGYTDDKGPAEANRVLSERRAEAVKAWLVKKMSIEEKRISTKGRGVADPVAPNTNPDGTDNREGRQKNRRVSVVVSG